MINKKQALEILNAALSTGGDYAEIFIEDTESESMFQQFLHFVPTVTA